MRGCKIFFQKKKAGPEYYLERGEECLSREDYHWALESFNKAIEFDPNLEMAYYKRAEVYKKLGRAREAVWDYIKFLEVDHRVLGNVQDVKDVLKETINVARMELQRNKSREEILSYGIPTILLELIEGYDPDGTYTDLRFYDFSLSWLEDSSQKNWYYTGFVQLIKTDFDKAIKDFDKAIEENPENPNAYYFRGIALIKKMKIKEKTKEISEEAFSNFEQALRKDFKWRICSGCGYKTSSTVNFCIRCGKKLLYA